MSTETIPPRVLRFLADYIDAVPHLESLLILWESGTPWDARELSSRVYLSETAAQSVLQDLHRLGLLKVDLDKRFSVNVDDAGVREILPEVAQTYHRNIARVATLIHNKTSSAREFARAFDLKKGR